MKYKLIRSMAHNWSHSFMSDMNYVDGGFVHDDLHALARARRGEKLVVDWIPAGHGDLAGFPPRVRQCVEAYRAALPEHLARHRIDAAALKSFRTEIYVAQNFRMYVRAVAVDDRNKEHVAFVWH